MNRRTFAYPIAVFGVAVAALVFFVSARSAAAQIASGGSISGVVKDEQGAVLPGVTVTASSAAAPGVHTVITDGQGLSGLLTLRRPGMRSHATCRRSPNWFATASSCARV